MRAGPRNRPSQDERKEHEATHVPFRDWCTRCIMNRGRSHHHVTKRQCEDESRRPTIAVDCNFMEMEFVVNAHTILEESVAGIAVKEDRRQNIMRSVALKKRC